MLLCAKEAGFITGQVIAVDGGASLMDPAVPLPIQLPALQPAQSR
jgi:enoyl-[acyl-carrier protein] reductase III